MVKIKDYTMIMCFIRYDLAHHHGKFRRKVILDYFEEILDTTSNPWCDICQEDYEMEECEAQIVAILKVFPNKGEKQVYDIKTK